MALLSQALFASAATASYGAFSTAKANSRFTEGELEQEFIEAVFTFQVIKEGTDCNAGTDEYQAAAQYIAVSVGDIGLMIIY